VDADFAVELGADDDTLDMPWTGGADGPRYYDLKLHPEFLSEIPEAQRIWELREFLATINSTTSSLETAKCDAWFTTEIHPHEEMFGGSGKFASYVDLLFSDDSLRFSFDEHEQFVGRLVALLKKAPEISAAAELIIRRCYYQESADVRDGLYITFYLFGYGNDEAQARQHWAIGLKLVQNALRQLSH